MKKTCLFAAILSLLLNLVFTIETSYAQTTATVSVNTLNVRSGPSLSDSIITQIKKGETYPVLKEQNDWINIKLSSNQNGWVAGWLVSKNQETAVKDSGLLGQASAKVNALNVRKGPALSYNVVTQINKGNTYPILSEKNNWVEIKLSNNESGWVAGWLVSKSEAKTSTPTNTQNNDKTNKSSKVISSTVNGLNVRSGPGTNFQIIGQLNQYESVPYVKEQGNWTNLVYEGKSGWAASWLITTSELKENDQASSPHPKETSAVVKATSLNVRSGPSTTYNVIGAVKKGEKVSIIAVKEGWYQINFHNKTGWISKDYVESSSNHTDSSQNHSDSAVENSPTVTLLYNGTNLRKGPSTSTTVIGRGDKGDQFQIIDTAGSWYKIQLSNKKEAYVAGWIVKVSNDLPIIEKPNNNNSLKDKKLVIDAGHGGYDSGSIGAQYGTLEKLLTLHTAKLLAEKLKAAGASVSMTRTDDYYTSLSYRVSLSHYYKADAFISIHYDSALQSSAKGITTYYYSPSKDQELGQNIQKELAKGTGLFNRGVRFGNFHVLRNNGQPAVLLELGFLSNPQEEYFVRTNSYQEKASQSIYNGLIRYFSK
ncbi:SH3 domain-containing protein [Bacillus taeanensis]|uniref:N-acetylmuramoyl-L-alanine amidase n=1 Tax=Bacillus taeanensis TaxID=273032 RepID=A0A366Y1Z8_9BACI|nr:SH3 domain-containing protein [Bacillus taeanensis]RBW70433.1 N-acetylmuramoyl-L-alanine amidase [Bacillus taeanensis]